MKIISAFSAAALGFVSLSSATEVSYDPGYDDPNRGLEVVACSDGEHGLMTRYNWSTQGQIPNFAYIGGTQFIAGWNSPQCGTCWSLTYDNKTIYVYAIDYTLTGFNIALEAMNDLTNGNAEQYGRVDADYAEVEISHCKMPDPPSA